MNVIVTLDDRNGMLFNRRRQSRDRELIRKISEGHPGLWISPFSSSLFPAARADENFLDLAEDSDT